jgi:hypothetical protein
MVVIWPAADDYIALRAQRVKLARNLARNQVLVEGLPRLRDQTLEAEKKLHALEMETVSPDRIHVFRGHVVELVRQSGCQIRRIQVGDDLTRSWEDGSDPLDANWASQSDQETNVYDLHLRPFSVSVNGPLTAVKDFLQRLEQSKTLAHTKGFTLRPDGPRREEVVLDIELVLLALENHPMQDSL